VPVARNVLFFAAIKRGRARSVKVVVKDRAGRTSKSKKLRLR
jgi:signal recognition particle GTPase